MHSSPLRILIIALGYAALGYAGLLLAIPPGYASPVFPAAGLALALVLIYQSSALPGIWLGSVGLNLLHVSLHGSIHLNSLFVAILIGGAATLQAWVGNRLIRQVKRINWHVLETELDIGLFLLLGGVLACLISATGSVSALALFQIISPQEFNYTWWNWYTGDTLGVLVFCPMALAILTPDSELWRGRRRQILAPMVLLLAAGFLVFYAASYWEKKLRLTNCKLTAGSSLNALLTV